VLGVSGGGRDGPAWDRPLPGCSSLEARLQESVAAIRDELPPQAAADSRVLGLSTGDWLAGAKALSALAKQAPYAGPVASALEAVLGAVIQSRANRKMVATLGLRVLELAWELMDPDKGMLRLRQDLPQVRPVWVLGVSCCDYSSQGPCRSTASTASWAGWWSDCSKRRRR
jgi:hypothetical protein